VVSGSGAWKAKAPFFSTGALVKLCHAMDSLYLSVFPPAFILPVTHFDFPLPAGSFSPVLNSSGASSGGIAPTAGQYGSVILCTRPRRHQSFKTNIPFQKIYSLTRLSVLTFVILNLIGLDVTTPYNCQVNCTPSSTSCLLSDGLRSEGLDQF